MSLPSPEPEPRSALGGLLQTRYEYVDLGTFRDRQLRGRVRRRTLRLAVGRGHHLSAELGQVRPVAIEVISGGVPYDISVPAPTHPWLRLAGRLTLVWLTATAVLRLTRRARRAMEGRDR